MKRTWSSLLCLAAAGFVLALLACLAPRTALAQNQFIVDDEVGLLTSSEQAELQSTYTQLTEYVDAAFVTTQEPSSDVKDFAKAYVNSTFGSDPAVIFVIDMYNREICVYANDAGLDYVSKADARAITDNTYKYASKGDYYGCASVAFEQILARCGGSSIPRPVKHITNLMIALVLGVLINFFVLYFSRVQLMRRRTSAEGMRSMAQLPAIVELHTYVTKVTRYRHSSRSGGGHHGGGGGGFHGGGGGGGSHRF